MSSSEVGPTLRHDTMGAKCLSLTENHEVGIVSAPLALRSVPVSTGKVEGRCLCGSVAFQYEGNPNGPCTVIAKAVGEQTHLQ